MLNVPSTPNRVLAITSGIAITLDCLLIALAPTSSAVLYSAALLLVLIVWFVVRRIAKTEKGGIVGPAIATLMQGAPLPVLAILVAGTMRSVPVQLLLACTGGLIFIVALLGAAFGREREITRDPRRLRWFFNQPW